MANFDTTGTDERLSGDDAFLGLGASKGVATFVNHNNRADVGTETGTQWALILNALSQDTPIGKKCVQIGTHGDGLSAETEEMSISPGAPQSWTPGACPAEYG
jgi:hypothetical protein